jgi:hypothetical protein
VSAANNAARRTLPLEKPCEHCGTPFEPRGNGRRRFCSYACSVPEKTGTGRYVTPMQITCEWCGKARTITNWEYRSRLKHNGRVRFCSAQCFNSFRSTHERGEKSHMWQGGNAGFHGHEWGRIRKAALNRAGHRCERCKACDVRLHVHHKVPAKCFATKAEAHALSNLAVLCPTCHVKAENTWRKHRPPLMEIIHRHRVAG